MRRVQVVIVSYNSDSTLRRAVTPLLHAEGVQVTVVDNASPNGDLSLLQGLPVDTIELTRNGGFAHGCNVGWRSTDATYVLFLNPDATIDVDSIERLARELDERPELAAVAPRIVDEDGALDLSLRRFPRPVSTFAQALFLHRLFPRSTWTDEVIRDAGAYEVPHDVDWVSGACVMVRRSVLEQLDGLDEGYFHYCEDIDLCRRVWTSGSRVGYLPAATAVHEGGVSAPRAALLPVLARARIRYARKHRGAAGEVAERAGVALGALTHALVGRGGRASRAGHLAAFAAALGPIPPT